MTESAVGRMVPDEEWEQIEPLVVAQAASAMSRQPWSNVPPELNTSGPPTEPIPIGDDDDEPAQQ